MSSINERVSQSSTLFRPEALEAYQQGRYNDVESSSHRPIATWSGWLVVAIIATAIVLLGLVRVPVHVEGVLDHHAAIERSSTIDFTITVASDVRSPEIGSPVWLIGRRPSAGRVRGTLISEQRTQEQANNDKEEWILSVSLDEGRRFARGIGPAGGEATVRVEVARASILSLVAMRRDGGWP